MSSSRIWTGRIEDALKLRVLSSNGLYNGRWSSGYSAAGKEARVDELLPFSQSYRAASSAESLRGRGFRAHSSQKIRNAPSARHPMILQTHCTQVLYNRGNPPETLHLFWLLVHRYDQVVDLMSLLTPESLDGNEHLRSIMARVVTGEPVATILNEDIDQNSQNTTCRRCARTIVYTRGSCDWTVSNFERLREPVRLGRLSVLQRLLEESIRKCIRKTATNS